MQSFIHKKFIAISYERPLKNGNFCSSSRKVKIPTTGIYRIFRGLKFEPDAEIGHNVPFRSLRLSAKVSMSYYRYSYEPENSWA